jgi:hypothetical protein
LKAINMCDARASAISGWSQPTTQSQTSDLQCKAQVLRHCGWGGIHAAQGERRANCQPQWRGINPFAESSGQGGLLSIGSVTMMNLVKPEAILTHESDLDGLVSGLLLRRLARALHGEEPPLQAFQNYNWRRRAMTETSAWVCDLAFDARLDRPGYLVVDHHPTDITPRSARLIHDCGKSSGLLCYELCRDQGLGSAALDRLVHLNNVADLFLVDDPDFEIASDYANLVKTYQFWNLLDIIEGSLERLLDHPLIEVMAVKRRVEDPLGLAWSRANITPLSRDAGYVPVIVGNANKILHRLLVERQVSMPVLLSLIRKSNGLMVVSLRSRNGEALRLAGRLQGGGHPNAAGATLPRSVNNVADAITYMRQVLNPAQLALDEPGGLEGIFESVDRDRKNAP